MQDIIIQHKIIDIISTLKNDNNNDLYLKLKELIKQETDTTEYLLNAISYNYIGDEPLNIIKVNDLNTIDSYKLILPNIKPRLIMVFGPSASGKTTCSSSMIKLFSTIYTDFPTCFMTLDGGKLRKASKVYQMIIKQALEYNIDIASHNLFPKVKNTIMKYFENQIATYNTQISLYIPITLGKSHIQSYSQYIEMTKDYNWVGIFIWQHKFDCIYTDEYKCNSCAKSGIEREKVEGKKYKIHKWEGSMEKGLIEVKKAKGGFYCIHNGGRPGSSMMVDYNNDTIFI